MSGALALAAGVLGDGGSWIRRLRPASFRGVAFHFDRVTHSYGRRFAMHEYPGRDIPWAEPLGRKQRTWKISGYLIGDNFPFMREVLRRACEDDETPGTLILPIVGRVEAVCTDIEFDDARQHGRYSAVSLSFAESGHRLFPTGAEDTLSLIAAAAAELSDASQSYFLSGFNVGSPSSIPIAALSEIAPSAATSTLVGAAARNIIILTELLERLRLPSYDYDQAPLIEAIDTLATRADQLVYDPSALVAAIDAALEAFTETTAAEPAFLAMLTLSREYVAEEAPPAGIIATSTPELRTAETRNAQLLQSMVRRLGLREIGYALPSIDLDNTERALETRQTVFDAFLAEADLAADLGDDADFSALNGLAHQILDDIDNRAAQLPSLATYRTPRSVNALVLAYQLYGEAERDLDIVARTGAINPAFMPLEGRVLDR